MADNVARIIAAASAAFTASNMAVSYATYRRKRPKATLSATGGPFTTHHAQSRRPVTFPLIHLKLTNSGETPLKVNRVWVERGPSKRALILHGLSLKRLSPIAAGSVLEPYDLGNEWVNADKVGEPPLTFEAFSSARWAATASDHFWGHEEDYLRPLSRLRVTLDLPGGKTVHSAWFPLTDYLASLPCRTCEQTNPLPGQLSFDELTE
jgi:hypothetical protein